MHGFADAAEAAGNAFRKGDLAAVPEQIPDEMVEAFTAAGPIDKVRERVAEVAERGDGVFLTPATYFIPPEQIGEYQARICRGLRSRLNRRLLRFASAASSHCTPSRSASPAIGAEPRIGGPWPGSVTSGSRFASLRIDRRASSTSGVRFSAISSSLVRRVRKLMFRSVSPQIATRSDLRQ